MTDSPGRAGTPAAPFAGRGWVHLVWWLAAWNAVVPIRLVRMILDPGRLPGYMEPVIQELGLEHTTWAIATYVMFRLALRARREPLRRVLAVVGAMAVALMVLRLLVQTYALDSPRRPHLGLLWFAGPEQLMPLIAAAALGLLVVVYAQRERDSADLRATLQAELAPARLQALRLQLNPHCVFNALNSIASLVQSDTATTDAAIAALAAFLRGPPTDMRSEGTTPENELRLVDAYLEIESLRFEWLMVDLDVPDALRAACVPAFALQLLVEHAIRHGLVPRRAPGRVLIAARRDGDRLALCVSEDGVGLGVRTGDPSLGIGRHNVRARPDQLHGADGELTIERARPHGTAAAIRIPYRVRVALPAPRTVGA